MNLIINCNLVLVTINVIKNEITARLKVVDLKKGIYKGRTILVIEFSNLQ